jgi:hypothetical protein
MRLLSGLAERCQRQAAVKRSHYVCLSCERKGRKTAARLCSSTFSIVCQNCEDRADFIPPIDLVGRVVNVQGKQLYLAPCCGCMQEYTGTGEEFIYSSVGDCAHTRGKKAEGGTKKKQRHRCSVWNCPTQALPKLYRVVDHQEGRIEDVHLCFKHTPPEDWLRRCKNFKQFSSSCKTWEAHCKSVQHKVKSGSKRIFK